MGISGYEGDGDGAKVKLNKYSFGYDGMIKIWLRVHLASSFYSTAMGHIWQSRGLHPGSSADFFCVGTPNNIYRVSRCRLIELIKLNRCVCALFMYTILTLVCIVARQISHRQFVPARIHTGAFQCILLPATNCRSAILYLWALLPWNGHLDFAASCQ